MPSRKAPLPSPACRCRVKTNSNLAVAAITASSVPSPSARPGRQHFPVQRGSPPWPRPPLEATKPREQQPASTQPAFQPAAQFAPITSGARSGTRRCPLSRGRAGPKRREPCAVCASLGAGSGRHHLGTSTASGLQRDVLNEEDGRQVAQQARADLRRQGRRRRPRRGQPPVPTRIARCPAPRR